MAKRRSSAKAARGGTKPPDEQVFTGAQALHDLFQQQMRTLLDRTDLDEEQKQAALLGASCPCCGAGGFSFTAKLRRRS
jgi:hypothetical protein